MSAEQDIEDVRRVQAGNVEAFDGLVRRWQGPLMNLAYRFCRDRAQAEDMVQDAFLRAYRKLGLFDGRSAFSSWMFRLATNVFVSQMRRTRPAWLFEETDRLASDTNTEASVVTRDRDEVVRRAVLALPDKYRSAVIVYYFHGKALDRAADSLGVSAGTLKSRLHRGRKLLERRLKGRVAPDAVLTGEPESE